MYIQIKKTRLIFFLKKNCMKKKKKKQTGGGASSPPPASLARGASPPCRFPACVVPRPPSGVSLRAPYFHPPPRWQRPAAPDPRPSGHGRGGGGPPEHLHPCSFSLPWGPWSRVRQQWRPRDLRFPSGWTSAAPTAWSWMELTSLWSRG